MADLGTVGRPGDPGRAADEFGPDIDETMSATPSDPARAGYRAPPWNQTGAGSGQPVVVTTISIW